MYHLDREHLYEQYFQKKGKACAFKSTAKKKGQLISCPQMLTPKHTSNTERIALQM
jgi:hypothetical protein